MFGYIALFRCGLTCRLLNGHLSFPESVFTRESLDPRGNGFKVSFLFAEEFSVLTKDCIRKNLDVLIKNLPKDV